MLDVITAGIILLISSWACLYNLKKCKEGIERGIYALIALIIMVPITIYLLDKFNVPSFFKWNQNINSQDWLLFLSNYITGIISAVISGVILIGVTAWQIKRNDINNMENLRINNMPTLNYKFDTEPKDKNFIEIITGIVDGNIYNFNIEIENVGMNSIKNLKVDLKIKSLMPVAQRILGEDTIHLLKKDGKIFLNSFITFPPDRKTYDIEMIVYYEDVLANWYMQQVDIQYSASNIFNQKGEFIGTLEQKINEEKRIDKKDINNRIL